MGGLFWGKGEMYIIIDGYNAGREGFLLVL